MFKVGIPPNLFYFVMFKKMWNVNGTKTSSFLDFVVAYFPLDSNIHMYINYNDAYLGSICFQ